MQTFKNFLESTKSEVVTEILNPAQRMRLKARLKKSKAKIALGRKRNARKLADKERLKNRASRAARAAVVKKVLKGKKKGDLSYAARANVEKLVANRGGVVKRLAKRLLPKVRQKDRAKFKKKK